jgi:hypothetical protein
LPPRLAPHPTPTLQRALDKTLPPPPQDSAWQTVACLLDHPTASCGTQFHQNARPLLPATGASRAFTASHSGSTADLGLPPRSGVTSRDGPT